MTVDCHFCHEHIDPDSGFNWQRIAGWERKSARGSRRGGSDIALRKPIGETFACGHCIEKLKRQVSATQESLL